MHRLNMKQVVVDVLGVVATLCLGGCGGESAPATCPDADKIAGECAGVPADDVCGSDTCTEGVTCAEVIHIGNDAELHEKAKTAAAGACLSLAPGAYTAVNLPGGVSL